MSDVPETSRAVFERLRALEGTAEYQRARNTIVEANLTLVHYAASRFPSRTGQREDIVQVGTIGLIKAVDRFDPARGVGLASFALPTIVGEMKRFFRDTSWSVRVPRGLKDARVRIARSTEELTRRLGRTPTARELAHHLDLEVESVTEAMAAVEQAYTAVSLDSAPADGDSRDGNTVGARMGAVDPGMESVENVQTLRPLLDALDPRDRRVLAMRFGAEMSQSAIADRIGVSQVQVSRILGRVLAELRRGMADSADSTGGAS